MIVNSLGYEAPPAVDLLPWADPYIAQLFRDANLLEEEVAPAQSRRGKTVSGRNAGATIETVLSSDGWQLSPMSRQRATRMQRSESAHQLARC